MNSPVFLVGCMRSGTTMSANFPGTHPIHCPFELRTIWSEIGNVPMASPKTRDRIYPCLKETDVTQDKPRGFQLNFKGNRQK